MGKIVIYRNGQPHIDLVERGGRTIVSASQNKAILSDDSVTLRVNSRAPLDIAVNDTFSVFGDVYRINQAPSVQKNSNSSYEYGIIGQGLMFDLLRCKFFNADGTGFKTDTDFPIIGDIQLMLTVVANNMHRFSNLWEVGNFPANTETKTITFNDDSCLSALQKICQEFKTEFWIKNEGGKFKVHTGAFGSTIPQVFEYGKGKGLYNLSRNAVDEQQTINRLYVNGGSENIPADYRNFASKLKFSDAGYLEDAALIAANGLKEGSIEFEEIYPHRTGKITSIGSLTTFSDATMDFDLNEKNADGSTKYLIAGTTAKLHFNKGNLAGYEFEVQKYDTATKTFTIIPFKNEQKKEFPDKDSAAFQFAVGDEYVITDIVMPQTYIANAEAELLTKGNEQFALLKQAKISYDLNADPKFLQALPKLPEIGDLARVVDSALGIDKALRINQITRDFIDNGEWNDYRYKIVIADAYEVSFASQLVMDMQDIRNVVNVTKLDSLRLSQIGLRVTEELKNSVFDTDGYFDPQNIKPFSIETGMLSVGAKSQQLSTSLIMETNVAANPNNVKAAASKLYSQTLNKVWDLAAFNVLIPDGGLRYVYANASKNGGAGTVYITTNQMAFDADPNDYYFLLGMLSSVIEGVRVFVPTIGSTTITGGLVRTGIISSNDGATTFNLNTGEITGKITFRSGSTGYNNLSDKPDLSVYPTKDQVLTQIADQTVYIEYSADKNSWHLGFQSGDLYMRQKKGSGVWSEAIRIVGEKGEAGTNGQYTDFQFAKNTSATTAPTSGWQDAPPPISEGEYVWMRSGDVIPPSTTPNWTAPVRISGVKGEKGDQGLQGLQGVTGQQGIPGPKGEAGQPGVNGLQGPKGEQGIPGTRGADGKTYYTHIAYANSANGVQDFSTWDSNRSFIGMYVDENPDDSTLPSAYAWTKVMGADGAMGIPGTPGANGQTPYLHIAYANSADGVQGFDTVISVGKEYIGTYTDFSPNDSNSPSAYSWSKIKGEKGADAPTLYTWMKYADSPTSGMSDDGTNKAYIGLAYNKATPDESVIYSDYTWTKIKGERGEQGNMGVPGIPGANGQSLYTWIKYKDALDEDMYDEPRASTRWIGIAVNKTVQAEGNNPSEYTWSLFKGDQGIPGQTGSNGLTSYFHIKYAPVQNPQAWQMGETPDAYIGTYVDFEPNDKNDPNYYTWSRFMGLNGQQGIPGVNGTNGQTYYLHIAYADTATGGGFSQDPTNKSYIGTYTDFNPDDKDDPGYYTWAKFRGEPITSISAPANPYAGMVWIDTSANPPQQKIWDGGKWVIVNDVQVGGRNLLATANFSNGAINDNGMRFYEGLPTHISTIEKIPVNEKMVLSAKNTNLVIKVARWRGGQYIGAAYPVLGSVFMPDCDLIHIEIYGDGKVINPSFIAESRIKLEKGNKATDWTPAPEDVQGQIDANAANISANTALTAANSQLIGSLNQKTDWINPSIDPGINAIMAGTLAVGNPADGVTAVISGRRQFGAKDLRIGAGKNPTPGNFNFELTDDGVLVFKHSNGQKGFEIGISNGRLTLNGYHSTGAKLFELDPSRGLVNVAYIPESWTPISVYKTSAVSPVFDQSALKNEISNVTNMNINATTETDPSGTVYSEYKYTIIPNLIIFQYENGTIPDNSQYANFKGYKITSSTKTDNVDNGWYVIDLQYIYIEPMTAIHQVNVTVLYIEGGKIMDSRIINFSK